MNKRLVSVLVVLAGFAPVAMAESSFANHVDLFQASTARDGSVTVADAGYHFTAFRVFKRVQVLGAGIMFDVFQDDYREAKANTILTAPIVDIALKNPDDIYGESLWVSFGARYGYNLNTKDHGVLVGFSVSFR